MADPGANSTPRLPVAGKKSPARPRHILQITIGYGIGATLWILLSDALLAPLLDPAAIQRLSTVKGLFFVIVTTLLLFFALRAVPDRPGTAAVNPEIPNQGGAAPWSGVWVYFFAVAATLATLLLRFAIPGPFAERPMMVLFIFPVIVSAMAGGIGPGLVATLTAALAVDYFTCPPLYSLRIAKPLDLFHWSFLVADGVLVSILSEILHRLRRQTEASRQLQAVTLASIGDGVITTDNGGRITFLNPEAERLTGWPGGEALGRPLAEIFRVINEQTRLPVADPVQLVLTSGGVMSLDSQAILLTRDGRDLPIHDSGAPIRLADTTRLGVVLVFRDDTQRRQAEAAVREERALYQDLVNAQPAGIYRILVRTERNWGSYSSENPGEVPYLFETVSDRFCEILGVSRQELAEDPGLIGRRVHPDDAADFTRANTEANLGVTPFLWEGRMLNGAEVRWVHLESLPRQLTNGDIFWTGILTDISARKWAEIALRESESTYSSLVEHMLNSVVRARVIFADTIPIDMEYLAVNPAFATVTGIHKNVVGRRINEVIPDYGHDNQESLAIFGRVALSGEPARWEHYLATLDRWFSFSIYSPAKGEVIIITDNITERKKAELALRENEARLRAISDNLPDGYIYQSGPGPDGKARFLYVSAGVTAIHGLSPEEVVGDASLLYRQVDPAQIESLARAEKRSLIDSSDFAFELHVRRPEGTWRWLYVRSRPRRKPDGQVVWDGVVTDITARKAMEGQLIQAQKMEFVGRLAGGVAHDFNNMLTVISGHAELAIERTPRDDPRYLDLQEIQNAARRSANLTRQLLAFARKQTVSPVVLDINDTLAAMLKMLQRLIGEDIDLVWLPGHELWRVKIDPSQIDQLLANLAVNARDAIAGVGKVTIETANQRLDQEYCAAHPDIAPGEYVELAVSDTGCGMAEEVKEHLFEPFFTTKKEGEGTGLGLATVYGIIKQNRGAINLKTAVESTKSG